MIKLGIIGTGGMAKWHADAYNKIKGVKIIACCDVVEKAARKFSEYYSIPAVYTDYRDMLDREGLDGVAVTTPDAFHAEISLYALKKKIAVLCEKPMAISVAQAKQMVKLARQQRCVAMINFTKRNFPAMQEVAKIVRRGDLGRIMHVEASYLQSWLSAPYWGDWRKSPAWIWRVSTRNHNLGCLGDIGCHIYDMMTFICGGIDEVYCTMKTFKKEVPGQRIGNYPLNANDSFISNVTFKNGAIGTIHGSRWATGSVDDVRMKVFGDKGAIRVDYAENDSVYHLVKGARNRVTMNWKAVQCKATPNMWERFIEAVKTGKSDASDFANGLNNQILLHYSFESYKKQKPVKVR